MTDTLKAVAGEEQTMDRYFDCEDGFICDRTKPERDCRVDGNGETVYEEVQDVCAELNKLAAAVELDKEAMRAMAELLIRTPQTPYPDEADINRYLDGVLAIAAREGVK
jgi:hypothetical protein